MNSVTRLIKSGTYFGRSEENCEFAANCDAVSEPLVRHDLRMLTGLAFP